MKGVIHGRTIRLQDEPPREFIEGEKIEIEIINNKEKKPFFPTLDFCVKDDYLSREKIYEE